ANARQAHAHPDHHGEHAEDQQGHVGGGDPEVTEEVPVLGARSSEAEEPRTNATSAALGKAAVACHQGATRAAACGLVTHRARPRRSSGSCWPPVWFQDMVDA